MLSDLEWVPLHQMQQDTIQTLGMNETDLRAA